jgi:predicted dehydrogenase
MNKKILVIGLGSMGKRRIRNLFFLNFRDVCGVDIRDDRRAEVSNLFGIKTYSDIDQALNHNDFDMLIISVPPDIHSFYLKKSIELNTPSFVEASVLSDDLQEILDLSIAKNILIAPSFTMGFHPAIRFIKNIIDVGQIGVVSNVIYHSGQYLPYWHPYEKVSEFYVSKKETGGAREIVPFELTWICFLFGFPNSVVGMHKKTIEIEGAPLIDDTYNCLLDYQEFFVSMTVDVVSRKSTRRFVLNGSLGQVIWDWNDQNVKIKYNDDHSETFNYEVMSAHDGYNKNITEEIYINELKSFIDAVLDGEEYPNNLKNDLRVLGLLEAIEKSYLTKSIVTLS